MQQGVGGTRQHFTYSLDILPYKKIIKKPISQKMKFCRAEHLFPGALTPFFPPPLSAYGPVLGVTTVGSSGLIPALAIPALALSTSRRFSHCKQASSPLTLLF